jgi:hypothetical protein
MWGDKTYLLQHFNVLLNLTQGHISIHYMIHYGRKKHILLTTSVNKKGQYDTTSLSLN